MIRRKRVKIGDNWTSIRMFSPQVFLVQPGQPTKITSKEADLLYQHAKYLHYKYAVRKGDFNNVETK